MARIIAITDESGELLGTLRADPVDVGGGKTLRAVPFPTPGHRHHLMDVPDDLLGRPAHEVHGHVRRHLAGSKARG